MSLPRLARTHDEQAPTENYLHLDPYPEIRGALAALKGRKLAILSNGSPGMLQKLVQNSGLDRWIEAVISIDSVRKYKPHRSCYALVEPVLGVSKEEVLFVSSNSFDLVGAKAFGFKVAWIDPSEWRISLACEHHAISVDKTWSTQRCTGKISYEVAAARETAEI